ncbi:putative sodium-coupled neutral amino acid transporter 10 [Taenia solium]|eukprot:TsM_000849300 transcript=TsM_000849300 gene=TsM_000849300
MSKSAVECGIILMTITLLLMTLATYYSCILTINSTNVFRCDSLERAVGLNVAISDLGSEIFSTVYSVKADFATRRCVLLFVIALVTPFCFLRRVDFLSATSSVAVVIYVIFLLNLFLAYVVPKIFSMHSSMEYFRLWRPEGLVRQVSTIYSSLKNPPLATMKKVLLYALSFIFACYSTAGLMGYIAFYRGLNEPLPGDMLASYPEDHGAVHIRLGFLYTIAASLPLLLFPLRTALHSLLFEETVIEEGPLYVDVPSPIPNLRFYWLTCGAIFLSVIASQTTDKGVYHAALNLFILIKSVVVRNKCREVFT